MQSYRQLWLRLDLPKTFIWIIWTSDFQLFPVSFVPCWVCKKQKEYRPSKGQQCLTGYRKTADRPQMLMLTPPNLFRSSLWDIRIRAINHQKQHMWTAVGLYSAYKSGSTQGAEGTSIPNLNQPCYKIEVWCGFIMACHPPEQHAAIVSETSAAGGARSLPVYWVCITWRPDKNIILYSFYIHLLPK